MLSFLPRFCTQSFCKPRLIMCRWNELTHRGTHHYSTNLSGVKSLYIYSLLCLLICISVYPHTYICTHVFINVQVNLLSDDTSFSGDSIYPLFPSPDSVMVTNSYGTDPERY